MAPPSARKAGRGLAGVKRGNLHPEQHQIGKRGAISATGRLGQACG